MRFKSEHLLGVVRQVILILFWLSVFCELNPVDAQLQAPQAQKTPVKSYKAVGQNGVNKTVIRVSYPVFEDENRFCLPNLPWLNRPFYRSKLDGAACCRAKIIQAATVVPEVTGECALQTKTDENGILNPAPLWCSYTCSLKKLGVIDVNGNIKPLEFFNYLTKAVGQSNRQNIKIIMEKHFKCFFSFKNPKFPCYTPLGFHKCYIDALEHFCVHGMPKDHDFSKFPQPMNDYVNIQPACKINGKQIMPDCCHGKPLPWTVADIIEAPRDQTTFTSCMANMQDKVCSATCFMNSAGVVNDSMELDLELFNQKMLGLFPFVKPSIWMNFLGPLYVFFDETLEELHAKYRPSERVCLLHDKILNFHENKIIEYCGMTPEELRDIKSQTI